MTSTIAPYSPFALQQLPLITGICGVDEQLNLELANWLAKNVSKTKNILYINIGHDSIHVVGAAFLQDQNLTPERLRNVLLSYLKDCRRWVVIIKNLPDLGMYPAYEDQPTAWASRATMVIDTIRIIRQLVDKYQSHCILLGQIPDQIKPVKSCHVDCMIKATRSENGITYFLTLANQDEHGPYEIVSPGGLEF